MAPSTLSYPPPPSSASSSSPSRSLFSAADADDDELLLADEAGLSNASSSSPRRGGARRRPPTLAERLVPPALRQAASRRVPQASQLVPTRALPYAAAVCVIFALGCLVLQLQPSTSGRWPSSSGGADASSSSPVWSPAHATLYAPDPAAEGDVCAFLDPTLGFPTAERKLIDQLRSTLTRATDGAPRWLAGRKLDLDPAATLKENGFEGDYLGLTAASSEGGPHPLFGLVVRGEQKFRRMVGRRSRSLKEAVGEYKRRYGRPPPRGFDRWWSYVRRAPQYLQSTSTLSLLLSSVVPDRARRPQASEHAVLLPDEYDSIWDSLAPFMGLTHDDFTRRLAQAKSVRGTVMLEVKSGAARAIYTEGLSEVSPAAFLSLAFGSDGDESSSSKAGRTEAPWLGSTAALGKLGDVLRVRTAWGGRGPASDEGHVSRGKGSKRRIAPQSLTPPCDLQPLTRLCASCCLSFAERLLGAQEVGRPARAHRAHRWRAPRPDVGRLLTMRSPPAMLLTAFPSAALIGSYLASWMSRKCCSTGKANKPCWKRPLNESVCQREALMRACPREADL